MASPKIIEGWHRTYDRPVPLPLPSAQESAEFLRRHRDKQGREALAEIRRIRNARLNVGLKKAKATRDSNPFGTFLGNEAESTFKPTPPPTGHREGFEGSVQCGCKSCADRRKKTGDSQPVIKSIADLNAANRRAFGTR